MIDLKNLTIAKAQKAFTEGEYTSRTLTEAYLAVIEKRNASVNAYLEVFSEEALRSADEADKVIQSGNKGRLTGIPIALKDNILIKGHTASAASKILESFVAPYDATATLRLKAEGAIILGRTNMDEFAMGSSTENSGFAPTKNPIDETKVPGGSSGGSAAAVAMNGALVALGSDTGGSVRQPASFCGCVGLKPTYGALSRHGLIALASSLDQIGPITSSVSDTEVLFSVLRGTDPEDSTSFYPDAVPEVSETLTLGVPRNLFEGISADSQKNIEDAILRFKSLGYTIRDIEMPTLSSALAVYYILMPAEASSNLARFDGVKYGLHQKGKDLLEEYVHTRGTGFGSEVRRRIMLGTYVLSAGYSDAYYRKAEQVRLLIREEYDKAFAGVDLVITPTTPTPAFALGEKVSDPLSMYLADVFTVPANISGHPAITLPGDLSEKEGLPLGVQLVAPHYGESILFRAGKDFLGEQHG
jgi:aspartyl-tRNA(Asn)/glutamyl-tRNA(Gln) amidotransferase subunit A